MRWPVLLLELVTAFDIEAATPALFARRGEPFNYAAWAAHALGREGCWVRGAGADRDGLDAAEPARHCYASGRPRPSGDAGADRSVFDFLASRDGLSAKLSAARRAVDGGARSPARLDAVGYAYGVASRGSALNMSGAALAHGADQLDYLVARGALPRDFGAVADAYRDLMALELGATAGATADTVWLATLRGLEHAHFLHNTLIYYPPPARPPARGSRALSDRDWAAVDVAFGRGEVVVLDDVLAPWALEAAYAFCLEATVYFEIKAGYLGAYGEDGLAGGVFALITAELRRALPGALAAEPLRKFWSYKYDNAGGGPQRGIAKHADAAAANLNLWITPDAASLDDGANGMTVYDVGVDSLEDFLVFQGESTPARAAAVEARMAARGGGGATTVPYARNRLVLFNSRLVPRESQTPIERVREVFGTPPSRSYRTRSLKVS